MEKAVFILFITVASSLFSSCNKQKLTQDKLYNKGGVEIRLVDISDNRCPEDAVCIWEGEAIVYLKISNDGQSHDFSLSTNANSGNDTTLLGKHIELIEVSPYPKTTNSIAFKDYEVKIKVTN